MPLRRRGTGEGRGCTTRPQRDRALARFSLSVCPRVHSSVQSSIRLSYFFNSGVHYRVLDCLSRKLGLLPTILKKIGYMWANYR
ncbi:unnamed protein product [Acanthoscelides obtectus]|uniref:Uncharacterized protein n=1 Tax=Acanthoscelides obtectus TaxID=200917 RepID=A0A9P0L4U1_ACAOB|nr:unnamed protein product [Acanthoscelides obtectus]CAK1676874.1 hypothetical protein AOBTE_LOCUS30984 [Acanthoscelides obtectus]